MSMESPRIVMTMEPLIRRCYFSWSVAGRLKSSGTRLLGFRRGLFVKGFARLRERLPRRFLIGRVLLTQDVELPAIVRYFSCSPIQTGLLEKRIKLGIWNCPALFVGRPKIYDTLREFVGLL